MAPRSWPSENKVFPSRGFPSVGTLRWECHVHTFTGSFGYIDNQWFSSLPNTTPLSYHPLSVATLQLLPYRRPRRVWAARQKANWKFGMPRQVMILGKIYWSNIIGTNKHGIPPTLIRACRVMWMTPILQITMSCSDYNGIHSSFSTQLCPQHHTDSMNLHPHFYSIGIPSYTVTVTNTVHYKSLLGVHILKVQDQNLSRYITSNQVLTIPPHTNRFCISPTQLENIFSSSCILNPK